MAKMAVPVIPVLVAMMLLTGVCNTLLSKYQDMQCVANCDARNPRLRHNFEQPVIQTAQMFIGEAGCWLVVAIFGFYERWSAKRSGREGYAAVLGDDDDDADTAREDDDAENEQLGNSIASLRSITSVNAPPSVKALVPNADDRTPLTGSRIFLLSLPTICDIVGTTLMNIGLLLVAASIYQMTRGALVLFVGLFSVIFLSRRLLSSQWAALFTVVLGVFVVGLSGALYSSHKEGVGAAAASPDALRTIIGVLIIAGAQIFTATQFVLEEWILEHYALEPIKVVAWEGTFGFGITLVGMIILHLAIGRTEAGRGGYFDAVAGIQQVFNDRTIAITSVAIMISIGAFNFFGLSVTRSVSATARSTIDTCRTLGIWFVSLFLGWETFKWLQVLGFALLVFGTGWFNGLWDVPLWPSSAETEESTASRDRGGMGVGLVEGPVEHV